MSAYALTMTLEMSKKPSEEMNMTTQSEKPLVLLVDDDEDFLFQHRTQLEQGGYRVVTAQGRKAAEELLERVRPDVAVLDVMMENPDAGFVLCHHIRRRTPGLPVILVTSINNDTGMDFDLTTEEDRQWIKADGMLSKPVRFEQLRGEIERLLTKSR